jgi:hypothetical protein
VTNDLTEQYGGRTPPGRDDPWMIARVETRTLNANEAADARPLVCEATDEEIPPGEEYVHVFAVGEHRDTVPDFAEWAFSDEAALESWLADADDASDDDGDTDASDREPTTPEEFLEESEVKRAAGGDVSLDGFRDELDTEQETTHE